MTNNRRDFIKKAAMCSVAITSGIDGKSAVPADAGNKAVGALNKAAVSATAGNTSWDFSFSENDSSISLRNGNVTVTARIKIIIGGREWKTVASRDGIPGRYAITDPDDDVQGYFSFTTSNEELRILFYHRTAQAYHAQITLDGNIDFPSGSFPCRITPSEQERVLPLSCGNTNSLRNDSVFSPENDLLLHLHAAGTKIIASPEGNISFGMNGLIQESSAAVFSFTLVRDYYKNKYVPYYHPIDRSRCKQAPTGWMSWNTYFDRATADDNLNEAKIGQKYLQPFGCSIWSIESWQENSDKLPVSDFHNMNLETSKRKFPKGMKKLADDIRKLGFKPGLWMAPFGTGNKEFYEQHRDWFLHHKSGTPVRSWNGRYTLDPTVAEAREHLKNIFHTASHDWGYEFFKIDGMSGRGSGYCAHLYERPDIRSQFRDPSCKNPFELCIRAFREGAGDDRIILACQGHTTGPEVLYADASRIGADIVSANEPVKWEGVHNQGSCFMNQAFTHNIVMYADPDTLLVNDLGTEEARVSATVVALPGQLTFFGDKLAVLPQDKMKLLQQTLPPVDVRPVNLYPYFSMLPVWNLRVNNDQLGDYNVIAFFNWEENAKSISVTADELGIPADAQYTVYEFWTGKYIGPTKSVFAIDVPAHAVRLMTVHPLKNHPHWISSDRHVSQAAVEMKAHKWSEESHSLVCNVELIGTFPLTMRFYLPSGYSFSGLQSVDIKSETVVEEPGILAVTLTAKKTGVFPVTIAFKS